MKKILIAALLWVISGYHLGASEIVDLINHGQLDKARERITHLATATRRDGNVLYYQALLEASGARALQFMEAALKAEVSPDYLEDNIYRMALYYQAERNYEKLAATAETYLLHWEQGRHRSDIQRLAALAFLELDKEEKAGYYLKRVESEGQAGNQTLLSQMDQSRIFFVKKEYNSASHLCRKLRNTKYSPAVVPALFMLSSSALKQKRIDDAILYYNILKERYPHAVGLDDLTSDFGQIENYSTDSRAEKITGTIYSVQVGVFSSRDNASEMAKKFKAYDQSVEIENKTISGKNYFVVYVGRFTSSGEALSFKERLVQIENEAYHVVAR